MCLFLGLVSLLCATGAPVRERFSFRNIDVGEGLPQNTVNAIIQDHTGFMWFGTKGGLSRFDGLSFKHFHTLGSNFITCLCEDARGTIWIGTDDGVYTYDPVSEAIRRFGHGVFSYASHDGTVCAILRDGEEGVWICFEHCGICRCSKREGVIESHLPASWQPAPGGVSCAMKGENGIWWIGTLDNGLWISRDSLKSLKPFTAADGSHPLAGCTVTCIRAGHQRKVYVGTSNDGLKEIDAASGRIRPVPVSAQNDGLFVRDILLRSPDEMWVATESGIFIRNLRTDRTINLRNSSDPYSLPDNAVYSLCTDHEQGVWIGTYFGGVSYYTDQNTLFERFHAQGEGTIEGRRVREITPDGGRMLWIGTEDRGVYRFDPRSGKATRLRGMEEESNIHGLLQEGDRLWTGVFARGLKRIDLRTGKVRTYRRGGREGLISDYVFKIRKTSAGELLLGTTNGLQRYEPASDTFTTLLAGPFVYDMLESSDGRLWLATYNQGVFCRNGADEPWKNFRHDTLAGSLAINKVTSVFEDSGGGIWFTTHGKGICRFDPASDRFVCYDTQLGAANNIVYQIREDKQGTFWISTNNGLVKFDPATGSSRTYTDADGLISQQFNYSSSYQDDTGHIYFGCIDGFVRFDPADTVVNRFAPAAVITDFQLFNRSVGVGSSGSPLARSLTVADTLFLSWKQNSFSLRLAALSFRAPRKNRIEYRLDGFDKAWIAVEDHPAATYANLRHGHYTFRMRAANNDGVWGAAERRLAIVIRPPFYLTAWACAGYLLLALAAAAGTLRYLRRRARRFEAIRKEQFEHNKEREVYAAKIDFFTNVAHEIRTPLTLIKGPLDTLLEARSIRPAQLREELGVMRRNTDRLLTLVNQLLDFRRTETREFRLTFVVCDIGRLLREEFACFSQAARLRGLTCELDAPETLTGHIDREAFRKIVSNLLANAVKYAATYVRVRLSAGEPGGEERVFRIEVENDGEVVPDSFREEIFKPFVRYNADGTGRDGCGTGIGLALSRTLAELHGGTLSMDAEEAANRFLLTLPLLHEETFGLSPGRNPSESAEDTSAEECAAEPDARTKPAVLVVDDQAELVEFLRRRLQRDYAVYTAANGREALDMLSAHGIDLVVCDVMMPVMDGFELCRLVKTEIRHSHIPVVLLTARTHLQSKIEGLELGADAYIEKPFAIEYLLVTVKNLLKGREKLREAFVRQPFTTSDSVALTHADETFLAKLNELIRTNMDNPDFDIDSMAGNLGLSRSSFYRKMRGTLSMTPNEYLRVERLKRAAVLLREGDKLVNEICYIVGFSSASYFTKCFQKQFGILPREFAEQHRGKGSLAR